MSDRWPGGIISKTPVIPTGPSETGSAPGIWTMDQASYWIKQGLWPTQLIRDPYFPYVTMLLGTTSLNGAQNNTFLDSSTNNYTITRYGNTTQGSFSPYGSNWSNYFDGTSDSLTYTGGSSLNFGTSDFTIELWAFLTNTGTFSPFIRPDDSGSFPEFGYDFSAGQLKFDARNAPIVAVTTTMPTNQWVHVAASRSGTSLRLFVNGTQVGSTTTNSTNFGSTTGAIRIGGSSFSASHTVNGYLSNFRVVKGTAVYTSNFTPPTQPLTAITNTSLLTCQSNRFLDASTNNFTITRNGDTIVTNFSPFAPSVAYSTSTNGGSGYFDGNDYLYIDSTATPLRMGTGDFTIECWVYQRNLSGAQSWVSTYNGPGSGYIFGYDGGTRFSWGDTMLVSSATTVTPGMWNHMAVTRSGTTMRLFKNGVEIGSATNSTDLTGGVGTTMGMIPTYNQWFLNGWLSDVRIVKGTALYTSAFTPPTTPLTVISNTSMLSSFTNAGIFDNSTKNDFETIGNAQVSTSVSKFSGSSVYFDGTGDYLTSNAASDLYAFGTGDFTVEMWFNSLSFANTQILYDSRPTSTDGVYVCIFVPAGGASVNLQVSGATQITGTATLSTGVWYHLALSRSSGSTKMFLNGTQVGSTYADTNAYLNGGTTRPFVGGSSWSPGTLTVNGYIDELRVTKGIARYTSNFTPPTAAFPTA